MQLVGLHCHNPRGSLQHRHFLAVSSSASAHVLAYKIPLSCSLWGTATTKAGERREEASPRAPARHTKSTDLIMQLTQILHAL